MATINPILAEEWHLTKNGDLSPRNVMAGSGKKFGGNVEIVVINGKL